MIPKASVVEHLETLENMTTTHILPSSYQYTWGQFSYIFVDDIYLITCVSVLYIRNKIQ